MTGRPTPRRATARRVAALVLTLALTALAGAGSAPTATAQDGGYQRISGEGSSWSANAIDAMRVNVRQFGITVDYNPSGSTSGRKNFLNGTVDFAASDIPFQFQPEDGSAPENPAPGSYVYIPVTAGGTAFMYNLVINGQRVTNLRLSGENVAKIFTGVITQWNDPAIAADNPGLVLPARQIVPVVRSDGSGSTAQFTQWMIDRHPGLWNDYCQRSGRAPACGFTSFYPTIDGMISQSGDVGVAGYVSQGFAEGAIGYVNYSYALGVQFPVAKVLNAAGYYTEPTPENVAVSLLQARINRDESNPAVYLTQQLEGVYTDTDPRNYQLSSYSYFILPTKVGGQFNEAKGRTLGAFAYYAMCQAQQQSASLGYSPMPINLVEASFEQIAKIPGVVQQDINIQSCNNPTFSPDGTNVLARNAPQPKECDRQGPLQCPDGTGGLRNVPTAVVNQPTGGGQQPTGGGQQPGGGQPGGGEQPGGGGAPTGGEQSASGGGQQQPGAAAGGGGSPSGGPGASPAGGPSPSGGSGSPSAPAGGVTDPVTGAPIDPVTGAPAPECDPDTGICVGSSGGGVVPGGAVGGVATPTGAPGAAIGAVTPTTLDDPSGWGTAQTLMLIVGLLVLGLVFAPALAWRYFSQQRGSMPQRSAA